MGVTHGHPDRPSCSTLLIGELSELLDQGLDRTSGNSGPHRRPWRSDYNYRANIVFYYLFSDMLSSAWFNDRQLIEDLDVSQAHVSQGRLTENKLR
ncbi:hypothetical protein HZ326_9950 [Fusarium oxysporum f. sp. albedinis]|nr:hypothetical protein HZ326_9950 [Fusarium oxysporum f. sp. albedinis]